MKKLQSTLFCLLSLFCLSLPTLSFAASNGSYIGVAVGQSESGYTRNSLGISGPAGSLPTKIDDGSFGFRVFYGKQYVQYLAIEFGIADYAQMNVKNIGGRANSTGSVQILAGDLSGKFILPVDDDIQIFAKFGIAYLDTSFSTSIKRFSRSRTVAENDAEFRPLYGIGASYDFNDYLSTDVSWTQINGGPNTENVSFGSISLNFHF